MYDNKSSTKYVKKDTDELADTLLTKNKYSTNDVDKVTDEFVFMKQQVNTICRKGLYQFRVNLLDIRDGLNLILSFLKQLFIKFIHNYINHYLKMILKIKTWKCIKRFLYHLMNNQ